jgi:hypothetical protein
MSRERRPTASEANRQAEIQYLLRRAVATEGQYLAWGHLWASERERWRELVFALLTHVTSLTHPEIRALTDQLDDAGLLDVSMLAEIQQEKGRDASLGVHARSILDCLQEGGFGKEEALRGLDVICEAALSLQRQFDGKVQRYLRRYGELMLRELDEFFHFTALDAHATRAAFTYWLQNALNMPLPLLDERVTAACQRLRVQPDELIVAADELGINLAFLDDVLLSYDARRTAGGSRLEQTDG